MNTSLKAVSANRIVLTIFIFIYFFTNGFAQDMLDKTITFSAQDLTIQEVLLELSRQTATEITFSNRFFGTEKISVDFKTVQLEEALRSVLEDQPIDFKWSGERILLFKKKMAYYTLSGYIEDRTSGERLIAATVYVPHLKVSAVTNEYGFFSLKLPKGKTELVCNYIGYDAQVFTVNLTKDLEKKIGLELTNTLEEIIVQPETLHDSDIFSSSYKKSAYNIASEFVQMTPKIGGVNDPIRSAQLLAGVQSGTDGLGGVYVRGGDSGHNTMMLDGVPIYIPYHLFGVFSVYNQDMVKSTKLFKGSFPAFYGGSLASVFDIRTKEGNQYRWSGNISSNLVHSSVMVEGPLQKEKTSLILASRISHFDFLFNPFFKQTYFNNRTRAIRSFFYDINAKLNHTFSNKNRVYLSFYQGRDNVVGNTDREIIEDDFEYEEALFLSWRNTIFSLRWNHLFNEKFFANTTYTHSYFNHEYSLLNKFFAMDEEEEDEDEFYYLDLYSSNGDAGIKTDFDYIPSARFHFRFGGGIAYKNFSPALTFVDNDDEDVDPTDSVSIGTLEGFRNIETLTAIDGNVYLENQLQLHPNFQANIGLRASSFTIGKQAYFRLEPRMFLTYQLGKKVRLRASLNKMVQYLHLVTLTGVRLPNDLWMPTNEDFTPQESWQTELGLDVYIGLKTKWSLDFYSKKMKSLFAFSEDYVLDSDDFKEYLEKGKGRAKGLELSLQHDGNERGGLISYAYTTSKRQFLSIRQGDEFRHARDLPHQLKIFVYQKIGNFTASLNWMYNTKGPRVNVTALNDLQYYRSLNNEGNGFLTDYHRLDLNINYTFATNRLNHQLDIGVYNLYNRKNIAHYRANFDNDPLIPAYNPVHGLGIRPSLAYKLSF